MLAYLFARIYGYASSTSTGVHKATLVPGVYVQGYGDLPLLQHHELDGGSRPRFPGNRQAPHHDADSFLALRIASKT